MPTPSALAKSSHLYRIHPDIKIKSTLVIHRLAIATESDAKTHTDSYSIIHTSVRASLLGVPRNDGLGEIIRIQRGNRIVVFKTTNQTITLREWSSAFHRFSTSYNTFTTTPYRMSPLKLVELKRTFLPYLDRLVVTLMNDILTWEERVKHLTIFCMFLRTNSHIPRCQGVEKETTKLLEFLKDYDFDLSHYPCKLNVVVNALSKKPLYWKSGYRDLRDSSLLCEVTLKSMKLGMLK
ncbi:hypothetical protein CR513_53515, partial [Mucuna pruriens]